MTRPVASTSLDAGTSPRRPKHDRTNGDIATMTGRMIRALRDRGLRDDDLEVLKEFARLRDELDRGIEDLVTQLRGYPSSCSWSEIGTALGLTRQAAQQRFPKAGGIRRPGGQEAKYR
ncbi:MAG TPA: hypothetical protein VGF51_12250 [Acidimicrobiales bacterium]